MSAATFQEAFTEAKRRLDNWPTLADVPEHKNPLVALGAALALLEEPSLEVDRYIQAMTNTTMLPLWLRHGGRVKSVPTKRFPHFTSDLKAAMSLYAMVPGGVPETISSNPLEVTKDAFRRIVENIRTEAL